jgi:hypothetical protein
VSYTKRTASIDSLTLSPFDPISLTFLDEVPFHMGYHAKHSQYDVPYLIPGQNVRIKHGYEGSSLFTPVNQVEHIARVPAEAVETHDDKLVTWP